jgi:hypothetical protein
LALFRLFFPFDFAQNLVRNGWIYRFEWLSLYNRSVEGLFNMLNPFMHSEMQFKQQKIIILSRFTSPNADQKKQKVELLAKPINKVNNNHFPLKMNHLSQ